MAEMDALENWQRLISMDSNHLLVGSAVREWEYSRAQVPSAYAHADEPVAQIHRVPAETAPRVPQESRDRPV